MSSPTGGWPRRRRTRGVAIGAAVLLASLATVTWRQARALEALAELDRLSAERTPLLAEREELELRVQELTSRERVLREARSRLGMRLPDASEIMILPRRAP